MKCNVYDHEGNVLVNNIDLSLERIFSLTRTFFGIYEECIEFTFGADNEVYLNIVDSPNRDEEPLEVYYAFILGHLTAK